MRKYTVAPPVVESRSDQFLRERGAVSASVTNNMIKSVSGYRREQLEKEVEAGLFRDGNNYSNMMSPGSGKTGVGVIAATTRGFTKTALSSSVTNSSTGGFRGSGGTVRQTPELYSPLWMNSNLNLPRDRATINAWSRAYFALNGIVHNAINLHSTYPISKLNIKCKNAKVERFFSEMAEEIDLLNVCVQVAQEYFLLGESVVYAELDEANRKWSRLIIQNPDYVVINRSPISDEPQISLRPDDQLKRVCTSNRPADVLQRAKLDKNIVEHVKRGENIPLDNFYVSHIARKINPYDVRGTGLVVSNFRNLMLFDKLRECKFAQAESMVNPLTLVKIGGADFRPTPADLEAYRQIFEESQADKDFKIFTHDAVTVEKVGSNSAILDINPDITQLLKEIYTGLMVPSVLMDGGQDTSYANGGVALDVLRQRYMQFRNLMTLWLRRKIFAPISMINDFYEYVGEGDERKKVLIIPDVEWNHMSLFDVDTYIANLMNLASDDANKKASLQTLYRSMGMTFEDEKLKIRQEDIWTEIRKKEKASLEQMDLTELRTLTAEKEITDHIPEPLPGEQLPGQEGAPTTEEPLPGMSPPDLSSPSAPTPGPTPTPPPTSAPTPPQPEKK